METVVEEDENNTETIVNQTQSLRLEEKTTTGSSTETSAVAKQVKRKKRKSRKSLNESSTSNETTLHTIIDTTMEVG